MVRNEAEKSGGNLKVGNAQAAFERFVQTYPHCQDNREKILAIDLLIHEFHCSLLKESQEGEQITMPNKPAGLNLLRGSTGQILEFLNNLTYGGNTDPVLLATPTGGAPKKPVARRLIVHPDKVTNA